MKNILIIGAAGFIGSNVVKRYAIDFLKLKEGLGWNPKTNFHTFIKEAINWYISKK
jgi:dTDP-D-glucose 4,6-dehydratase